MAKEKKKSYRKEYLNDFRPDETGKYSYQGEMKPFSEAESAARKKADTAGASALFFILAAGFVTGRDIGGKAYVLIPYLIAILVAVGMFRASGAMNLLVSGMAWFFALCGLNTDFVPALPTALMRPLSGSGARGLMVDAMMQYGADSFVGRLVSIVQGSTDTTFYILAVYFGSVKIKDTRYAVVCGLIADFFGILAAIILGYIFFH